MQEKKQNCNFNHPYLLHFTFCTLGMCKTAQSTCQEIHMPRNPQQGYFMKDIYEKLGLFYLGKDAANDSLTLYKSKDLTTHAAIIGMTGSGKTGLGIGLIEEAAIDNIPSIVIDPKGDMGNLCLAFPKMQGDDFLPWVDASEAANNGKSLEQTAEDTAGMWKKGIESFAQDTQRVQTFGDVQKTIFSPGSSAGVSVNILGNFEAPSSEILEDTDTFSSLINATVSSLLALINIEGDSINSKEHILLSNIFYFFWTKGISLSLEDLIGHVATPPFEKIGVLALSKFYPQEQRMKLAMLLNSLISSLTFASWTQGEPLDIQNMLYDANGKAKISIFSISHLNDNERMFFVTILLNAYISWMRRQRGSTTLKAILYMDEVFGFFPPSKNPPSKEPMLLLLKQARAFGTGIILSTQNPVDLDYKALSNIGTWFIGKLQTKQDIEKVVEGIASQSVLEKEEIAAKIASLKGRHFFLKNINSEASSEFYTRWTLSYLKGPLRSEDIKELMLRTKNESLKVKPQEAKKSTNSQTSKPIVSETIKEYFVDSGFNADSPLYPALFAHAKLKFFNQAKQIDTLEDLYYTLSLDENTQNIHWQEARQEEWREKSARMIHGASYAALPEILTQEKTLKKFEKQFGDFLYDTKSLELFSFKELKLSSKLHQSKRDFLVEAENILKEKRDEKVQEIQEKFQSKYKSLENKLEQLEFKFEKEESDVAGKATDTILSIGLTLVGAFFGNKGISASTITKGATAMRNGKAYLKEKNDLKSVSALMENIQEEMHSLELDLQNEIQKSEKEFNIENYEIQTLAIKPKRSDIRIEDFALLWER